MSTITFILEIAWKHPRIHLPCKNLVKVIEGIFDGRDLTLKSGKILQIETLNKRLPSMGTR